LFKVFAQYEFVKIVLNGVLVKDISLSYEQLKVKKNDLIKFHFAVYGVKNSMQLATEYLFVNEKCCNEKYCFE
jgi:hypothetical protein